MKKLILTFAVIFTALQVNAGNKDQYLGINGGFLYKNSVTFSLNYEIETNYRNAFEINVMGGNNFAKDPDCGKICREFFFKDYWIEGGLAWKPVIKHYKNSNLRLKAGASAGSYIKEFNAAAVLGLEYNIYTRAGVVFTITQENHYNFLRKKSDMFKAGLLLGIKIPL